MGVRLEGFHCIKCSQPEAVCTHTPVVMGGTQCMASCHNVIVV